MTGPAFCESPVWSSPPAWRPSSIAATAEHLVDGDDARAADADQAHASPPADGGGRAGSSTSGSAGGRPRLRVRRDVGDERRAVAVEAAVVPVAAGLVDPRLAAELGVDRLHRQAAGPLAAVAAALADALVDEHAPGGSGARPRLRSRRSSAAHAWSWIITVTPAISRQLLLHAHHVPRGRAPSRSRAAAPRVARGSSLVIDDPRARPRRRGCARSPGRASRRRCAGRRSSRRSRCTGA